MNTKREGCGPSVENIDTYYEVKTPRRLEGGHVGAGHKRGLGGNTNFKCARLHFVIGLHLDPACLSILIPQTTRSVRFAFEFHIYLYN